MLKFSVQKGGWGEGPFASGTRRPPPTPTGAGALRSGQAAVGSVGPLPVPVTGAVPPLRADSSRGVHQ